MINESSFKKYFPFLIIVVVILGVVYLPGILKKNKYDLSNTSYRKNIVKDKYNVNEYISVYVDDEQMSKKYLKDFLNNVFNDFDASYNLLNKEFREYKFGGLTKYREYIESLNLSYSTGIFKYSTYEVSGYKYYDLYDKSGHRFIFKTNGVLQYEVFFEDYKFR